MSDDSDCSSVFRTDNNNSRNLNMQMEKFSLYLATGDFFDLNVTIKSNYSIFFSNSLLNIFLLKKLYVIYVFTKNAEIKKKNLIIKWRDSDE